MARSASLPTRIEVRGGQVHNLKNIDVDIPLHSFVAISGLSGSGKSSLAMGILYEEGSRRYLEALSTYTRRRIKLGSQAAVREVRHIPSALALKQRPTIPNERATVGTMSEVFNVVRLIFSRLGAPLCPNGHRVQPSLEIAQAMAYTDERMGMITCPTCGVKFAAFSAEDFAFNSHGACHECQGTGLVKQLDESKLILDPNLTLEEGAVASWHLPGRNFMPKVAEQAGVRIDVPYRELTAKERDFVLNGPQKKYRMDFHSGTGRVFHDFNALYENAHDAVTASAKTAKSARSQARINEFYTFSTCPVCHGTRLEPDRLTQLAGGKTIAEVAALPLSDLAAWQKAVQATLPANMEKLATAIFADFTDNLRPLLELGLDYLTLERSGNSLSTGELQRIQLARTLRTATTGVLYVLDEPSIGLHPANVAGLLNVFHELVAQGNSLVVVDHNPAIIAAADWVIEIGPGSGKQGGRVLTTGNPASLAKNPESLIGPYLTGAAPLRTRPARAPKQAGQLTFALGDYYNLHDVHGSLPLNQLTAVTGFSGAGKTSLILDSLVPAIKAQAAGQPLPAQVKALESPLKAVVAVDAAPVGKSTRSTVATYTKIMDNLRKLFAAQPLAKQRHYTASAFSYNNKGGACPTCGGSGVVTLDIQYLPDMQQVCPTCNGDRYNPAVQEVKWQGYSIVDLLKLDVRAAREVFAGEEKIAGELALLEEVGLGYLHLGEDTPTLSGGEAQRLKLVKHLNRRQAGTLFVFDEPTIGLHPRDVVVLLEVMQRLLDQGATIVVITHDLQLMTNADYLLDLGPRGGAAGGKIVAAGSPAVLVASGRSLTVDYLRQEWRRFGLADQDK